MIFISKLIPIVAHKVKVRDGTFLADHFAGALPVSDAVADLEREHVRLSDTEDGAGNVWTWQGLGRAEVAITRPNTEAATLFFLLVLFRLSWEKTEPPDSVASVDMKS